MKAYHSIEMTCPTLAIPEGSQQCASFVRLPLQSIDLQKWSWALLFNLVGEDSTHCLSVCDGFFLPSLATWRCFHMTTEPCDLLTFAISTKGQS